MLLGFRSVSVGNGRLSRAGGARLGGLEAFLSHPARVVLAIVAFVLAGVALLAGGNLSLGVREDRSNRCVIVAMGLFCRPPPTHTESGLSTAMQFADSAWRAKALACVRARRSLQRACGHSTRA
jgi:hypothetical protein